MIPKSRNRLSEKIMLKISAAGLADVATFGILERVVRQIDPARCGKVAHGDRLLALQRHHEGLAVAGRFALRKGDAPDLEATAEKTLERLLFLRACAIELRSGQCDRHGNQTGGCLQHATLLDFDRHRGQVSRYYPGNGPVTMPTRGC